LDTPLIPLYLCFVNIKKQIKMKTIITILATVLALQVNVIFAGNDEVSTPAANSVSSISLAPTTPVEATFEDEVVMNEIAGLAPVMPSEATFEDAVPVAEISGLIPVTPVVADFEDTAEVITIDITALAPVTPLEADFE
jgi:hypothetical protein